jgi:hypothetical protein
VAQQYRTGSVLGKGCSPVEGAVRTTKALLTVYIGMLANVITPLVDTQIRNVIADLVPKYDRNGNKKLNLQELIGFLNEAMDLFGWEIKVTREDTQQTLTSFDKNWDGELSYEEIYTTLRHIISKQLTGQQYFNPQPIPAQLRTAN